MLTKHAAKQTCILITEFQVVELTWNLETKLNHSSLICLLSTLLLPISWSETRSARKEFDIYNPRIKFEMFFFRNPRTRICIISHDIGVVEVVYESYELWEVWVSNSISNSSPLPKTHFYRGQPTWPSHAFFAFTCWELGNKGLTVVLLYMNAAELLGLPLIPAYTEARSGDQMRYGINYASAAAGILDITGRNFVSTFNFMFFPFWEMTDLGKTCHKRRS